MFGFKQLGDERFIEEIITYLNTPTKKAIVIGIRGTIVIL
jgi:hypothetical protein